MAIYRTVIVSFTLGLLLALLAGPASAKAAPDFPPGVFTDGKSYSMQQLRGRVVVLFFYEQGCPSCARKIPERNQVVEHFRGKPVTFIAVAAGDTASEAKAYVSRTGLKMPVFVDRLSMMEKLYGTEISLRNIYQFRVIDAQGEIVGYSMSPDSINKALARIGKDAAYDAGDYHAELEGVVERLNKGDYSVALRGLSQLRRDRDEAVKASAEVLHAAVLEEAKGWVEKADGLPETDAIQAGALYAKASKLFPREEFAKDSRKKLSALKSSPAIKDEHAARKMYAKMSKASGKMKREQLPELVSYARKIAEKYPETPTGKRCAELADKLGG